MLRSSLFSVLIALIVFESAIGQTDQGSKAPEQKSFSLNPDGIQALQNSVNLLTGQVAFPMNLVSFPGKGGLNLSVTIQYNSAGVKKNVSTYNQYSPTGTLGLGWNLEIPRIVVDNKETGTRHDDSFYLVEGGSSNPLICTSHSASYCTYATKNYNFWTIEYFPLEEKWVITRENGFQYVYGDKNSGRNTVQWMVKWGNWIGNSTQPDGQQQTGYIWNISQIQNLSGDKMTYEYYSVDEFVANGTVAITSEQKHTKASYLKKITDPIGQSVELTYQTKDPTEYFDPHQEQQEPDAYQEKFESWYLNTVIMRTAQNNTIYTVGLSFTNTGTDQLTKRYLTSITKTFPSGETQPPTRFDYFTDGESNGFLKRVSNSLGVHIDYYYQNITIANSARDLNLSLPGYGQPRTYVGGDYVVVTWRQLKSDGTADVNAEPVLVYVYTWDGRWIERLIQAVSAISNDDYYKSTMILKDKLFAYRSRTNSGDDVVIMAGRKGTAPDSDDWSVYPTFEHDNGSDPNVSLALLAGDEFVATVPHTTGDIKTHIWRGEHWDHVGLTVDESPYENFATAGNNYIIVHNDRMGAADVIHFYYLDEEKKWNETTLPSSVSFTTDGDGSGHDSYWHAANSFAVTLPVVNSEFIYQWDEDYQNFSKLDILGRWTDDSPVPIVGNSQFSISEIGGRGITARFDGENWALKGPYTNYWYKNISFGEDFFLRDLDARLSPRQVYLSVYDPNIRDWNSDVKYVDDRSGSLDPNNGIDIQAGISMFSYKDGLLYQRDEQGNWVYLDKIYLQSPPSSVIEKLVGQGIFLMAPNFIAYEYNATNTGATTGVYVAYLNNNKIIGFSKYPGYSLEVDLNTVVLHDTNTVQTFLRLLRVVDGASSGNLTTMVANATTWTDGNHVFQTSYTYSNGKASPDGQSALFNRVTVIPGPADDGTRPNGYREQYFHNGLPCEKLLSLTASCDNAKELLFTGMPYQTLTYNSSSQVIVTSTFDYTSYDVPVQNTAGQQLNICRYVRSTKTSQNLDGITSLATTTYNDRGFPSVTVQNNSRSGQDQEQIKTTYTYWYEKYSSLTQILSPVIQTISYRNDVPMASSVTTWRFIGIFYPERNYTWLKTGDVTFTAWDAPQTPSNDWKQTGLVNLFDFETGVALEVQNADQTIASTIYDATHSKVIAKANYASYHQIAYSSFEDASQGNWQYDPSMITNTDAVTGTHSYYSQQFSPTDPTTTYLYTRWELPVGSYELSFWSKSGTLTVHFPFVAGAVLSSQTLETRNAWSLLKYIIRVDQQGSLQLQVPVSMSLDDLRILPQGATMVTSCFNAFGQLASTTDANLIQTHYEYDSQYRIQAVRDHKGRIVKKYDYHYRTN